MIAKCIGYKYKTFRNYCYFCGLSFTPNTRKYLINYGNKFQTDLVCSKNCRDQAIYLANYSMKIKFASKGDIKELKEALNERA